MLKARSLEKALTSDVTEKKKKKKIAMRAWRSHLQSYAVRKYIAAEKKSSCSEAQQNAGDNQLFVFDCYFAAPKLARAFSKLNAG